MSRKKTNLLKISEPQMGYALDFKDIRVKARPFVKWAGGKSQLLSSMSKLFPPTNHVNRYFEPFLGGGAVFFNLQHPKSYLSDTNKNLVEVYEVVKGNVEDLIHALKKHKNQRDYFYEVRSQNPAVLSPIERAARFIYLNKTCFNGLYRENSKGEFNVPFGKYKNPTICDEEGLRSASLALRGATISRSEFRSVLLKAKVADFIYFDPPYQPLNKTSSFTSYTAGGFGEDEQRELANVYRELSDRGCFVMLSNSDTPLIRELYKGFYINEIQASRAINSKADGRGKITELLVINYSWVKNRKK